MNKQYIMIDYGCPSVSGSLPDLHTTRLGVMSRFWEHCIAFSAEAKYRIVPSDIPTFSMSARLLARIVYNPALDITFTWEECGKYSKEEVLDAVRRGLEKDDDNIQQWFDASQVIGLMEASQSFEEMVTAIRAICGEFETDKDVLAYVERALGAIE